MSQPNDDRRPREDDVLPSGEQGEMGDGQPREVAAAQPEGTPEEMITVLRGELEQAQDRTLRMQAELENLRQRMRREMEQERRYANLPLIRDLLPVVDNVQRAIDAAQSSGESGALAEGVSMLAEQLKSVLAAHHGRPIEALHQPFNPHLHEAILQQPSTEFPAGTVIEVTQPGYQLHDRVIRPAQVIVSSAPPEAES